MFRKVTFLALILTLCVVVLGAYSRLSTSGLGCAVWPDCYAESLKQQDSHALQSGLKLTETIQGLVQGLGSGLQTQAHLFLSLSLSGLILLLALMAWWQKQAKLSAVLLSSVLVLLVGLYDALSLLILNIKLMPVIVTGHFVLGYVIIWLLFRIYLRARPGVQRRQHHSGPVFLATVSIVLVLLQSVLGAWLSTNYAALSCGGFPLCNGSWWPQADYQHALDMLYVLLVEGGERIPVQAQIAVNWLHRIFALLTFLSVLLVFGLSISSKHPKQVRNGASLLLLLIITQVILGVLTVLQILPLWSSLAHTTIAAVLLLPLVYIRFYARFECLDVTLTDVLAPLSEDALAEDLVTPDGEDQAVIEREVEQKIPEYQEKTPETLFLRLQTQLKKTRSGLGQVLSNVALGQKKIDDDLLEEIEASLIMADVGVEASAEIINHLTENLERKQLDNADALSAALKKQLVTMLEPSNQPLVIPNQDGPFVILVVGVNGVGKTTTIGKMAKRLQAQGHSVMLAAGDTFRAAAVEQLQTWGDRNNIHVVAQHTGADSASVLYDGVKSAIAKNIDVLIADTAGRLHTKSHLMEELSKIKRIISKLDPQAPHEVLLVLDAGTGQNALSQAKQFNAIVELTGLALTKLDGTAKGGIIFALAKQLGVPVRFIGIGEGIDDLQDFHAEQFVDALFLND